MTEPYPSARPFRAEHGHLDRNGLLLRVQCRLSVALVNNVTLVDCPVAPDGPVTRVTLSITDGWLCSIFGYYPMCQLALQKGSHILAVQVIRHNLYKDATKDPSGQQQIQTTDAKSKLIKITEALR